MERQGPSGFTLREAARTVGVSHAAVYRHFADKAELLRAVAVEGMLGMRDALQASLVGIDDPVDAFQAFGVAYVMFAVTRRVSGPASSLPVLPSVLQSSPGRWGTGCRR